MYWVAIAVICIIIVDSWRRSLQRQMDDLNRMVEEQQSVIELLQESSGVTNTHSWDDNHIAPQLTNEQIKQYDLPIVNPRTKELKSMRIESAQRLSMGDPWKATWDQDHESQESRMSHITEDWPMKLWGLIFFLWVVRGVSYAFMNNRIPERWRVALWLITWVIWLVAWRWRLSKRKDQWALLMWLWAAIILVVMYIWRLFYWYFSPLLILLVSGLLVFWQRYIALKKDSPTYALYVLLFWLVAPLLTHSGDTSFVALFWYLGVLYAWSILVASKTSRNALPVISLVSYGWYSLPFLLWVESVGSLLVAVGITTVFFILFVSWHLWKLLWTKKEWDTPEQSVFYSWFRVVGGSWLLHLFWMMKLVPDPYTSLVLGIFGLVFFCICWRCFIKKDDQYDFLLYLFLGVLYLFVAMAFQFSGSTLIIAYLFLSLAVICSLLFLFKKPYVTLASISLCGIPVMLALEQGVFFESEWLTNGVFTQVHWILLLLIATSVFISWITWWAKKSPSVESDNQLQSLLWWTSNMSYTVWLLFWVVFAFLYFMWTNGNQIFLWRSLLTILLLWWSLYVSRHFLNIRTGLTIHAWVSLVLLFYSYQILEILNQSNARRSWVVLLIIILWLWCVWYFSALNSSSEHSDIPDIQKYQSVGLYWLSSCVFLATVWVCSGYYFENENTAHMFSLIVYTLVWISGYVWGANQKKSWLVYWAWAVIGGVILRLLFVDVRDMAMVWRIATFLSIGLLLIVSAYFVKNKREETWEIVV